MGRSSEGILLLLLGAALGPDGIDLLSSAALSFVDPAMPVALVALGILVGHGFGVHRLALSRVEGYRERRLLAAATAEAGVTAAVVAGGILIVAPLWAGSTPLPYWFLALVLGICAAPSAAASLRPRSESGRAAESIGDLDALLSIALGGIALALLRAPSTAGALLIALQACGVALVIVVAAWLLISKSSSETEQRVLTAALLLLLGGAADYLSLSALLSGLIAGLVLEWIGGPARDSVRGDVLRFQRPLLVLVLIVTGARVDFPAPWIGLGLTYLLVRTAGKLAGGWAARRVAGTAAPRDLAMSLLSPGVLGIAFALNVLRAEGPDAALLLAVATIGAMGSDVLAALVAPREVSE